MVLLDCANAYLAAVQMQQKEMDYPSAFALMMLKRDLQGQVEFLQSEELKLAEKYAEKDEEGRIQWTGQGTFPFRDAAAAEGYRRERLALVLTKVEETWTVRSVSVPGTITPEQLEWLDGFLVFQEES